MPEHPLTTLAREQARREAILLAAAARRRRNATAAGESQPARPRRGLRTLVRRARAARPTAA
jgi:hypothetical protein